MQEPAFGISRLDLISTGAALVLEALTMVLWISRPEFLNAAAFGYAALSWGSVVGAVATLLPVPLCWLCVGPDKGE